MTADFFKRVVTMDFPERLATLRKQQHFTQQALADAVGVNVSQLKRYEAATSQPTLDVVRKLSVALSVSADLLLFDKEERGPDDELRLQFEAVSKMPAEEKRIVQALLDGMIVKYRTKEMVGSLSS